LFYCAQKLPSRARAQNYPTQQNKQDYAWHVLSVDWPLVVAVISEHDAIHCSYEYISNDNHARSTGIVPGPKKTSAHIADFFMTSPFKHEVAVETNKWMTKTSIGEKYNLRPSSTRILFATSQCHIA